MDTFVAANIILRHFIEKDDPIRNMKLQKLLYFSCGWYSAIFSPKKSIKWLIEDDFHAWPYGPVCPEVYNEISGYGADMVTNIIEVQNDDGESMEDEEKIINAIITRYGKYTDWQLSNITHRSNTPWTNTIDKKGIGKKIERKEIQKHYLVLKKELHK